MPLNRQRSLAGSIGFESRSIPPSFQLMNKPRLVAQFFRELNATRLAETEARKVKEKRLEPETVREIANFITTMAIAPADFTAVRSCPGKYDWGNPYAWLWLLHRAMNHHGKELFR